jgi:opacity protein-like surface antigen
MRSVAFCAGAVAIAAGATSAAAGVAMPRQIAMPDPWSAQSESPATVSALLTTLSYDEAFADLDARAPGTSSDRRTYGGVRQGSPWAVSRQAVQFNADGFSDRLSLRAEGRLRRADGSPLPPGPRDAAAFDAEHYDVTFTRGWTETLARTPSGLDVTLTPHVGVGLGSRGGTTEAGATLRVGPDLDRLVPEGSEHFGDRPRWYLYAAGSGRAVGYNFARTRDGEFARSGVSHDSGAFLGDASLGVALRRGAMQGSFGLVYREIETKGLRAGHGVDTDVSEGLIAFQLSIKPD